MDSVAPGARLGIAEHVADRGHDQPERHRARVRCANAALATGPRPTDLGVMERVLASAALRQASAAERQASKMEAPALT